MVRRKNAAAEGGVPRMSRNENHISIREWQSQYRAGAYSGKDRITQIAAGWYDWTCRDEALAGRLKRFSALLSGITEPYILDNFCLRLRNIYPPVGPRYDVVEFTALAGGTVIFRVLRNCPLERKRWTLYSERVGDKTPEFSCESTVRMAAYINRLGRELANHPTPVENWNSKYHI